jgi:hypothetical protein
MDKKFFDNTIIAQYAVTGVPLKVYVDSRYLTITDPDDIENPIIGHGMEPNGEMYPFSYPDIDHLLVADNIIDLETYNKAMADQFKSDEPAEEAPEGEEEAPAGEEPAAEEAPEEEAPEEEAPEEEPTTEEGIEMNKLTLSEALPPHMDPSWGTLLTVSIPMIAKLLYDLGIKNKADIKKFIEKLKDESPKQESVYETINGMTEISRDEYKAQMDSLKAEIEAGKAKEKAAKEKMNDLKKQPIEESKKKALNRSNFNQLAYLSSVEYQKVKKLKNFNAADWKWDSKKDLYKNVRIEESVNEARFSFTGLMNDINKKQQAAMDARKAYTNYDGYSKTYKMGEKLDDLYAYRSRIMQDMDQEAEPEGGRIADRYGKQLNDLDSKISKLEDAINTIGDRERELEKKYQAAMDALKQARLAMKSAMQNESLDEASGTIAKGAYSFADYFGIPVSRLKGFKFDGTDDVKELHKVLGRASSNIKGTENIYNKASITESVNEAKSPSIVVTINKSNRYYNDGPRDLSGWYAKEFSEYLFGSKYNLQATDLGKDQFTLEFTGKGLSNIDSKVDDYVNRLNNAWKGEGLKISLDESVNESVSYLYDPHRLIDAALRMKWISEEEASQPETIRAAKEQQADDADGWDEDEGFGSSDFSNSLMYFMEKLGYEMDVKIKVEKSVNEGKWTNIMRGVRKAPQPPFSIVAIQGGKVVDQKISISDQNAIPAHYEDIKRKNPGAKISIENGEGLSLYNESLNEDVSSPYIYQVGDMVQNVNPTCPHHGSKGIVMSIEPDELTYSVTNSGDTFKPGMRLTKTLDQLAAL